MDQAGPSKSPEQNEMDATNAEAMDLPDDQTFEENPDWDTVDVHIANPAFQQYLENCGALRAINSSLTALYHADPKPTLVLEFFRDQLALHCGDKAPTEPLMELIDIQNQIKKLEAQHELLRQRWIARIQEHDREKK